MAYHLRTQQRLKHTPSSLGVSLARLAIRKHVSVQEIAKRTGASRATVYNWFSGKGVTNAYRQRVETLIREIRNT